MRRYRLAAYAVLAVLPFTTLAACQSGSSGSPAPAPGGSGAGGAAAPPAASGPSGSDSGTTNPPATGGGGGGGSNAAFCQLFQKAHSDLVADAQNGKASDARGEVEQAINAAPSDIVQAATLILNVQYEILTKDPQGAKDRTSPAYPQAEKDFQTWSTANC